MNLCSDCPPVGYPTDITRCTPCPRRDTKRFAFISDENGEALKPSPNGEYVLYTDHIAALEAVKAELDRQHTLHDNLNRKYEGVCAKLELAEERVEAVKATVKPLEWGLDGRTLTPLGTRYSVYQEFGRNRECWAVNALDGIFDTPELAKAAAQSDYERRVLSALVSSPALEANQQPSQDDLHWCVNGKIYPRHLEAKETVKPRPDLVSKIAWMRVDPASRRFTDTNGQDEVIGVERAEEIVSAILSYIDAVIAKPGSDLAHIDPDLEPGEYIVTIATKGGAAQINGPVNPAPVSLEAYQQKPVMSDHERGCQGREYTCTCGYDEANQQVIETLRAALEEIAKTNQIREFMGDDASDGYGNEGWVVRDGQYARIARAALTSPTQEEVK